MLETRHNELDNECLVGVIGVNGLIGNADILKSDLNPTPLV